MKDTTIPIESSKRLVQQFQDVQVPVEFHAFDAVHGKEDYSRREGFGFFHHGNQILERGQFDAAEAQTLGSESENCTPEFFTRIAQCDDDHGAGLKGVLTAGGETARLLDILHRCDCRRQIGIFATSGGKPTGAHCREKDLLLSNSGRHCLVGVQHDPSCDGPGHGEMELGRCLSDGQPFSL